MKEETIKQRNLRNTMELPQNLPEWVAGVFPVRNSSAEKLEVNFRRSQSLRSSVTEKHRFSGQITNQIAKISLSPTKVDPADMFQTLFFWILDGKIPKLFRFTATDVHVRLKFWFSFLFLRSIKTNYTLHGGVE